MIVLKDVSFQYEGCEEGVHGIDLTVCDGECVVLTGPSGGGKTTLTRLLNGLAPSYYQGTKKGDLWINYTEIASLPAWKIGQEIGSVFQDPKSQFFPRNLRGRLPLLVKIMGWRNRKYGNARMRLSLPWDWRPCGRVLWMCCPAARNSGWRLLRSTHCAPIPMSAMSPRPTWTARELQGLRAYFGN